MWLPRLYGCRTVSKHPRDACRGQLHVSLSTCSGGQQASVHWILIVTYNNATNTYTRTAAVQALLLYLQALLLYPAASPSTTTPPKQTPRFPLPGRCSRRPPSRSPSPLSYNNDKQHTQVIAFACLASFLVCAAPLFAWWSRIRFSCPLDLVVRSFGLGIFAMVWVVYMLFRLCSTGPMGRLLYMTFGRLVGVVVRRLSCIFRNLDGFSSSHIRVCFSPPLVSFARFGIRGCVCSFVDQAGGVA